MKKIILLVILVISSFLVGCSNPIEKGATLLEEKQYKEAIDAFQQAIDKDKNLGESYRGQGIAYWELEEYEQARESFMQAIEEDATKTGTIFNFIALCNMQLNNMKEALNYFELGLAMEGNSKELIQEMKYNEIVIYESMKEWEKAKTKMAEYIVQYPDDEKAAKEAQFLETR